MIYQFVLKFETHSHFVIPFPLLPTFLNTFIDTTYQMSVDPPCMQKALARYLICDSNNEKTKSN